MSISMKRRRFLQALGASAMALPLLPSLSLAAESGAFPRRLVIFFTANGVPNYETNRGMHMGVDRWSPSGSGSNFTLDGVLKPLQDAGLKKKTLVVSGLDLESLCGKGDAHQRGMGALLTNRKLLPGKYANADILGFAGGPSIDQVLAKEIMSSNAPTRFGAMTLGIDTPDASDPRTRLSYTAAERPVVPQKDPVAAVAQFFGGQPNSQQSTYDYREQVLRSVRRDIGRVKGYVGAEDRATLQAHEALVAQLQKNLDVASSLTCQAPEVQANLSYQAEGKVMMDLIAQAIACGATRIASLQWDRAVSHRTFPWLGLSNDKDTDGHHKLAHDATDSALNKLIKINTWYAEQFAYLLKALDSYPEGDGTVLDNTVVLWCSEMANGVHNLSNMNLVLGGSCGGHFKTGDFHDFDRDTYYGNLLVELGKAMGSSMNSFGDGSYCTGGLPALRA